MLPALRDRWHERAVPARTGARQIDDDDVAAVAAALRDPSSPRARASRRSRRRSPSYVGAPHAVAFANGTAALHGAAAAAGLGPGDEMLDDAADLRRPRRTARCYVGARPRFADVDPAT